MKAGWKTRPAERQYFEGKLAARMERAMSLAKAEAKMQALRMANNPTNNHDRWINLANPGKTRRQWDQEQRAKGVPEIQIRTGSGRAGKTQIILGENT